MTMDENLSLSMGIITSKFLSSKEMDKIKEFEMEMGQLMTILSNDSSGYFLDRSSRRTLETRLKFLAQLLDDSHCKVSKWIQQEKFNKKKLSLE